MKTKNCPECASEMTASARRCPKCGAVMNLQAAKWLVYVFAGLLLVAIVWSTAT